MAFAIEWVFELLSEQAGSCMVGTLALAALVARGRQSNVALSIIAVAAPVAVGAQAWSATRGLEALLARLAPDLRAARVAEAADGVFNAPVPFLLLHTPAWIAVLVACAGRTRFWPSAALAAAVPAALRAAFRVEPSSFASGWPVALPVLLGAGVLLAFARTERRETAAIAWAGLVPIILLSSFSLAELFPFVNYAALPVETHAERLGRLAEAASWNHRLVLLGTLAAWVPLVLVRARAALAAIPATAGAAMCSHDAIVAIMVRAYEG